MKLPDISDNDKMAHIGRITVLRRSRNDCAKKLRDKLVPLLNSIENSGDAWDVSGVGELLEMIEALSKEIIKLSEDQP